MGSFVNKNLLNDEYVCLEAKYHWIHYISWVSLLTIGILPTIQSLTDEYVITNKRVFAKKGILILDTFEINLKSIEMIDVSQSLIGRLLKYGDIKVVGKGGSKAIFCPIKNPRSFQNKYHELID